MANPCYPSCHPSYYPLLQPFSVPTASTPNSPSSSPVSPPDNRSSNTLPSLLLTLHDSIRTDEPNLDASSTLLLHQNHLWFLHPWLVEIRHRWRVLVLFVVILPVFDECVYLFLRGLDLVQGLWSLVHCFYLGKEGSTYRLKESP